jgi:hypothetical protein
MIINLVDKDIEKKKKKKIHISNFDKWIIEYRSSWESPTTYTATTTNRTETYTTWTQS